MSAEKSRDGIIEDEDEGAASKSIPRVRDCKEVDTWVRIAQAVDQFKWAGRFAGGESDEPSSKRFSSGKGKTESTVRVKRSGEEGLGGRMTPWKSTIRTQR